MTCTKLRLTGRWVEGQKGGSMRLLGQAIKVEYLLFLVERHGFVKKKNEQKGYRGILT